MEPRSRRWVLKLLPAALVVAVSDLLRPQAARADWCGWKVIARACDTERCRYIDIRQFCCCRTYGGCTCSGGYQWVETSLRCGSCIIV